MNPYVGPGPFEEEDGRFFYGREREARDLIAFVISEPLILFYAQSGAGKSSLINTRLIPGLRDHDFSVLPVGRVGGGLPDGIGHVRNIFTFNLLSTLEEEADPSQYTHTMLTQYLQQKANGHKQHRVLVIDQFEEIVTNHPGRWHDREDFFWQLQAAIHNDPNLWVVLSMREDHFAAVESFAEILPGGLRARFRMERLRLPAAKLAIEKPAAAAGVPFADGVANSLVKNLSLIRDDGIEDGLLSYGEYIEPVQLQVVCYQLWEKLKNKHIRQITNQHVNALADVDSALGQFYDDIIRDTVRKCDVSEIFLRSWFETELITEAHTRGTVYMDGRQAGGLALEVVNELANRYLLRSERRAGADWYELVHDRFVDPILQANARWRDKQPPIVKAALAWHESGRDERFLMPSDRVKAAVTGLNWNRLDKNVRDYAIASGRQKFEEGRRERLLQQQLAEATSNIKRYLWVLAGLLACAVIATMLAFANMSQARQNRIVAEKEAEAASTAEAKANLASTIALQEARQAETARAVAQTEEANARRLSDKSVAYTNVVDATSTAQTARIFGQETAVAALDQTVAAQDVAIAQFRQSQNAAAAETAAAVIQNATATERSINAAQTQVAVSAVSPPAGTIVFVRYPPNFDVDQGVIYRVDTDGSNLQQLTGSSYSSRDPSWSRSGRSILFSSNIDGDYELYAMDAGGELPEDWSQLTDNNWDDRGPVHSPDERYIAFFSDETGRRQLYLMDLGNDGKITPLGEQYGEFPAWSPNSSWLAFATDLPNDADRKLAIFDVEERQRIAATASNSDDFWPRWHPINGLEIVFTRLVNSAMANTYICEYPCTAGNERPLVSGSNNGAPDWSPDGQHLVFYKDGGDGVNIWIMNRDGSNQQQITFSGLSFDTQPRWSP